MNSRQLHGLFTVAAGIVFLISAAAINAQVQTQTTTAVSEADKTATVERGEVVLVDGNDLIVKMEDGTIRHFPNVPESVRIDVAGQQLGIHDLKPGMKLQRVIITTTTPQTITTVKSVTGKVWHVSPPNSVILTMENGKNQSFQIPTGQKFMIDGQQVDAWGLKKGMKVSATKVIEVPQTVISQQRKLSGEMAPQAPPPPAPPADLPILIAEERAPEMPPATLPKTGSLLPLIGLMGLLSTGAGFGMRLLRRA